MSLDSFLWERADQHAMEIPRKSINVSLDNFLLYGWSCFPCETASHPGPWDSQPRISASLVHNEGSVTIEFPVSAFTLNWVSFLKIIWFLCKIFLLGVTVRHYPRFARKLTSFILFIVIIFCLLDVDWEWRLLQFFKVLKSKEFSRQQPPIYVRQPGQWVSSYPSQLV